MRSNTFVKTCLVPKKAFVKNILGLEQIKSFVQLLWMQNKTFDSKVCGAKQGLCYKHFCCKAPLLFKHVGYIIIQDFCLKILDATEDFWSNILAAKHHFYSHIMNATQDFCSTIIDVKKDFCSKMFGAKQDSC